MAPLAQISDMAHGFCLTFGWGISMRALRYFSGFAAVLFPFALSAEGLSQNLRDYKLSIAAQAPETASTAAEPPFTVAPIPEATHMPKGELCKGGV
ncbi:MAG: hypothetical protein RIF44_15340, partial [Nitratireductor sp.]